MFSQRHPIPLYRTCVSGTIIYFAADSPFLTQEGLAPIHLIVETEMHRATPGGTGGVKTIGNYAAVSDYMLNVD